MAESSVRRIDRIDVTPRFTERDAIRLNNLFRGTATREMLTSVLGDQLLGDLGVVSSFGAESAVLLHLVASIDSSVPVLFLDTGRHFAETLAYRDTLKALLGLTDLRVLQPDPEVVAARDGEKMRWSFDPDGCCDIRKVAPLSAGLADLDASITGRKAFQASTRNALPRFELDTSDTVGRLKLNPLADWTRADIEAYFAKYELPAHPLVAAGYPSIGCEPCTSMVKPGEDPRAGRWRGWDKTECGIHKPVADGDPDQPVF